MPQSNELTTLVLKEIRSLRTEMNDGFRETRADIQRTDEKINQTDSKVADIDKRVDINKTKIGFMVSVIIAIGEAVKFLVR